MRVAALDLGTNTFILFIAEIENGVVKEVLHDEVEVVRLGQGVNQSRRFHPKALERAKTCLSRFSESIKKFNPVKVLACATSAARDVANQDELFAISQSLNIPLQIISGNQEAEWTYRGAIEAGCLDESLLIDIGGGSTEYILGNGQSMAFRQSLDIGSVRLTETYVTTNPIEEKEFAAMGVKIKAELATLRLPKTFGKNNLQKMIAVAGTPTTLSSVIQGRLYSADYVHGFEITSKTLHSWLTKLKNLTVEERISLVGMEPKRADVIVAGALILQESLEFFGCASFETSIRGLRYGIAYELAGR